MDIEDLLKQPESKTLEFKQDLSSMGPILKTLIAFANTSGGTLVIGRSAEGSIRGVKNVFKAEEALANAIADSIAPRLRPEIEIATTNNKHLLIIKVAYWKGPFYLKKRGNATGCWKELSTAIQVTFFPYNPKLANEDSTKLTNRQKMILKIVKQRQKMPFKEIAQQIPIELSERMLRYELSELKSKGYLSTEGQGRSLTWKIIE